MTLLSNHPDSSVKYEEIVADIHAIIDSEYRADKLISPPEPGIISSDIYLVTLCVNTNAFGLLSDEFINKITTMYFTDSDFRRIWGSIAIRTEYMLGTKHGITQKQFAKSIIDILAVKAPTVSDPKSRTPRDILETRVDHFPRLQAELTEVNDFWCICLLFYRLTMHRSGVYESVIENQGQSKVLKSQKDPVVGK